MITKFCHTCGNFTIHVGGECLRCNPNNDPEVREIALRIEAYERQHPPREDRIPLHYLMRRPYE